MGKNNKESYLSGLYIIKVYDKDNWGLKYPIYQETYVDVLHCIFNELLSLENKNVTKNNQDINNIFAFMGARGSGKTTAMEQFCQALENDGTAIEKVLASMDEEKRDKFKKVKFHCLDVVELSMLEAKEDIFEITLAKMLNKVYEKADARQGYAVLESDKLKQLSMQFDKVYRSYHAVKYDEQMDAYGVSALSKLKNLSSSFEVKKEFGELLDQYLSLWSDGNENSILVVPFDDLDLNIQNGYEMLEDIYRYMRHPRLVVLLTVDPKQLQYISKKSIIHSFKETEMFNQELDEHCEKLVTDFLAKICPLDNRIYMPDINSDYIEVAEEKNKDNFDSAKMFIIKKYAQKTGIFYDACGRKKHFCELETVRALTTYNDFLDSLYDVDIYDRGNPLLFQRYYQNFNSVYSDIVKRFATERLDGKQIQILNKLLCEDVSRWGRFIYKQYMAASGEEDEKLKGLSIEDIPYHYGDLLKCIYRWGREDDNAKSLIHVILALFSQRYTKELVQYQYDPEHAVKAKERLIGLMGQSFGGEWLNGVLPSLKGVKGNTAVSYGYIADVALSDIRKQVYRFQLKRPKKDYKELPIAEISDLIQQMEEKKVIETLEATAMFFCNCKDINKNRIEFSYEFRIIEGFQDKDGGPEPYLALIAEPSQAGGTADFDIWGFARSTIDVTNIYGTLHNGIINGIEKEFQTYFKNYETGQEQFDYRSKLKRYGLYAGRDDFASDVAIPFYNLDLTYNIFKRMRQNSVWAMPPSIDRKDALKYILQVYRQFDEELKKEIDAYGEASDGLEIIRKKFIECPFIDAMLNWEKKLVSTFDIYMSNLLEQLIKPEDPEPQE